MRLSAWPNGLRRGMHGEACRQEGREFETRFRVTDGDLWHSSKWHHEILTVLPNWTMYIDFNPFKIQFPVHYPCKVSVFTNSNEVRVICMVLWPWHTNKWGSNQCICERKSVLPLKESKSLWIKMIMRIRSFESLGWQHEGHVSKLLQLAQWQSARQGCLRSRVRTPGSARLFFLYLIFDLEISTFKVQVQKIS